MSEYISLGLMALLIFQQVYLTMTINRLVDKLMSRNYGDYVAAKQVGEKGPEPLKAKVDTEPVEDLNVLFGLGPN